MKRHDLPPTSRQDANRRYVQSSSVLMGGATTKVTYLETVLMVRETELPRPASSCVVWWGDGAYHWQEEQRSRCVPDS